ncbi:hypothetical protein EW026_g1858 [Hermanssonia centrifuga]|uniref:BHLH domain-containing protein n=1 Tax=Hermanssonia centrifuga TaxID=98765 RepID=A0A4S4KQ51_9APHY|nr:hypothetical protein EW026_g1858 [Hermanssonia centrifuga]
MSTPALSSSSSSVGSPSPSYRTQDDVNKAEAENLAFDDSDALQILLQTITQSMDSPPVNNPDDWAQLASWTSQDSKAVDMASDFNFAFPMDLDFDPNMAVDPSALHFNTSIFTQPTLSDHGYLMGMHEQPTSELLSTSVFPYGSNAWAPHMEPATGRRLSITSSSSSSGASFSPILEPQSAVSSSPSSEYGLSDSDPASELAQRVRQAAGVTLAVPVSAQVQQLAAAGGQLKLPIPRLPRPTLSPALVKRSGSSKSVSPAPELTPAASPTASSLSESSESASVTQSHDPNAPTTTVIGRPKTSHTTIERRYRTNLNARITGLKQAVPALRVLEQKNGQSPYGDIVDSRGFVDGVKVARKMSKANVLGKATEYIRVLKKREARLKHEQGGLKSLVGGLVGGPALLKEWEREWRDRFGGEERDEVEGEDVATASDDEDGDGEDSDGEDEEGRTRKKVKIAKAPKKDKALPKPAPPLPVSAVPGAAPEKRKRGRPRKVPLPSPVAPAPAPSAMQQTGAGPIVPPVQPIEHSLPMQQEYFNQPTNTQPTGQYLLAAFAFFSVFNSPLASSYTRTHNHAYSQGHAHHGAVLTAHPTMVPTSTVTPSHNYGLHELVQAFHLLVSTLVFFYVVLPWISGVVKHSGIPSILLAKLHSTFSTAHHQVLATPTIPEAKTYQRVALTNALSFSVRGSSDEPAQLRTALGVSTGVFGLMQGVIKATRIDRGLEMNQLEQRAWVRLGELVAFDGAAPRTTRLQTYWCMSWHVSTFATSTSDLATLALIILPVSHSKASELWDRARNQEILRPYEKIALTNMTIDDAAEWLAKWRRWHNTERKGRCAACEKRSPLGILAAIITRERLRNHAAAMFVRTVVPSQFREPRDDCSDCEGDELVYDPDQDEKDDQDRRETIEAGKAIGGRTAELAILLERIWDTGFCAHEDVISTSRAHHSSYEDGNCENEHDLASTDEAEIRSLLSATMIYRRIFPSSFPSCATAVSVILSPPPSPSRKNMALHVSLRAALASSAFDLADGRLEDGRLGAALDNARDRVNDMLTALERSVKRNTRM